MPDGLVLEPLKGALKPLVSKGSSDVTRTMIEGRCVDFPKPPPGAGMLYRVAAAEVQKRFQGLGGILRAARELAEGGQLSPDSDAAGYTNFVKQWSLWTRIEGWDQGRFSEAFLRRTRENVVSRGRPWARPMKETIERAAPRRWQDIQQVLLRAGR